MVNVSGKLYDIEKKNKWVNPTTIAGASSLD